MLLSGLMALHVGAFAAWLAAAAADAALEKAGAAPIPRWWAPAAMAVAMGAGLASVSLALPYYREQTWLWLKMIAATPAAAATLARAAGKITARRTLGWVVVPTGIALVLAFTRPF